jgi:choline dehydrogenase-like flavoprotein
MMLGGHQKKMGSFMGCVTREGDRVLIPVGLGGGSKVYGGLATVPDYDWWRSYGIDLEPYREWAEKETWVSEIPEEFVSPGEKRYAEAAEKAGFPMGLALKHIKFERCVPRGCSVCSYGCPRKARYDAAYSGFEAMEGGAEFVWDVRVEEPILENGNAVGFRGKKKDGSTVEARGKVVVGCAGGHGNVAIAREAGLERAGTTFAGDASVLSWGLLPRGQKGNQLDFPMAYNMHYEPTNTHFGSCMHTRMGWIGSAVEDEGLGMLKHYFDYSRLFVTFAKTHDDGEGYVYDDGSLSKTYTERDEQVLEFARETNHKILIAGGCDPNEIYDNTIVLAHPSATVPVGTCVDTNLEAKGVKNLFFCDCSVFPESIGAPTVLTLAHLARYMSDHLATVV